MVFMYLRLVKKEEQDMIREFGDEYCEYMVKTKRFVSRLNIFRYPYDKQRVFISQPWYEQSKNSNYLIISRKVSLFC